MTEKPEILLLLEHYGVIGRRPVVSCPLHEDVTPSCSINYTDNLFKCHSCGEGGDSWTLIMKKEGVDFDGAREWAEATLGHRAGDSGGGDEFVVGSRFGGRRSVSGRSGDRRNRKAYKPSWRSRG